MSLESYTGNIADLVVTNPTPTDPKSQGDDHLRGIKYTLQQTFPGFNGPLAASRVPFTPVGGIAANNVQAALQEVDSEKVSKSGDTMTGSLTVPTLSSVGVILGESNNTGTLHLSGGNALGSGATLYLGGPNSLARPNTAEAVVSGAVVGGWGSAGFYSSVGQSSDPASLTRKDYVDGSVNSRINRDNCTIGGFASASLASPYFRHENGTIVVFAVQSDRRIKVPVEGATLSGLDVNSKLTPAMFSYTQSDVYHPEGVRWGFFAQDLQKVDPALIVEGGNLELEGACLQYANDAFAQLLAIHTKAIQELSAKLDAAAAEIAALKAAK